MRTTWVLALLAVALLGAGAGLHALIVEGPPALPAAGRAPEPARHEEGPPEEPATSLVGGVPARPATAPALEASTPVDGPTLGGGAPPPPVKDVVEEEVERILDEEARTAMRLEALALSKSHRNAPAAALRWKALVGSATTTEEHVEALSHLARAQARSGNHGEAAESYSALLRPPAEEEYIHHGHRLQLAVALYNAKEARRALTEVDALRGDADVSPITIAGASWMRVQCLDALGDVDGARAAAQDLVERFESVPVARYAVEQARGRLANGN